jgi:hypothetical protein
MKSKVIWASALALIILSCHKEIEVPLGFLGQQPVINSLFTTNKPFKVTIGLSKMPSDTASYIVTNATVQIMGNNGTSATLAYTGNGIYTHNALLPQQGVEYLLKVNIPGIGEATAKSSIPPSSLKVTAIESKSGFITKPVEGTGGKPRQPVQDIILHFGQTPAVDEFFGIDAKRYGTTYRYINDNPVELVEDMKNIVSGYLGSHDPVILSEGLDRYYVSEMLMFKDNSLTVEQASVRFYMWKETPSKYWLRFYQFSHEAFRYLKSWFIHSYTKSYDFWEVYEPHPLFSNIENGYGIFAGYSMQVYEVYPDSITTYQP